LERLDIIEKLKALPVILEAETGGLSDTVLRYRPVEGEYSIKEIIGHLRELAEVWYMRLYATWSLTDPRWPAFDGKASVQQHNYQDADVSQLIATIREWRNKTADLLSHAVDWTRLGQHPELGRRSLKQWAEFCTAHDEEHIASIRRLKAAQSVNQTS
jgi:hypothetical protein